MPALTKIGECYSGLLASSRSRFRRVVLATPAAINKLKSLSGFNPGIQNLKDPGAIHFCPLAETGLIVLPYKGWRHNITLGLRLNGSVKETELFNRGIEGLASLEPGLHRRIALRMMGVEIDETTERLSPRLYAALFAKVEEKFHAPDFRNIASIVINSLPFDVAESGPDGTIWHFSLNQLEVFPKMSYLKIPKAE